MVDEKKIGFHFSNEEFLEFFDKKFGDYFTQSVQLNIELEKHVDKCLKKDFDRTIINISDSLESSCFHHFLFEKLHRVYAESFKENENIAENSIFYVLLDIELEAFIFTLRGSLDPLRRLIVLVADEVYEKEQGFGSISGKLSSLKVSSTFKDYIKTESDKWIIATEKEDDFYEEELKKYSRMDKKYADIIEIMSEPKLNALRRHLAHGRRIMTFNTVHTPLSSSGDKKDWHHSIPNKPFLEEGDTYTSIKTLDWMEKVFKKTLGFHLTCKEMLLNEKEGQNKD